MLVCVYYCAFGTRDRGCSRHPAFPAPSVWRGPTNLQNLGRNRAARTRTLVIPGRASGRRLPTEGASRNDDGGLSDNQTGTLPRESLAPEPPVQRAFISASRHSLGITRHCRGGTTSWNAGIFSNMP